MRGPHNLWRLIQTGATFERTGAMKIMLDAMDAPPALRLVARVVGWPLKWLGLKGDPDLPPVVRAIAALGPAYIKFGQILSTRPDVVGADLAQDLRILQDKLPPFPLEQAKQVIAAELGAPTEEIFSEISEPVAAASIAQVHKATLRETGKTVAIKVLRPGIENAFRKDLNAFYFAASVIEFLSPASRRLKPTDVVAHFDSVVIGELDLRLEMASSVEFARNTEGDHGFSVPTAMWPYSGRTVMTMDWVDGVNMGDNDALDAAGHDRVALADRILTLFLQHALRDGYFHADMHQGNLKVGPNGDIVALDFGIMGQIDEYTRKVYAEILFGFIQRDYMRVAEVHFEAGYVPADRDMYAFAKEIRAIGEPIFGKDATQISMGKLLSQLFDVTERFGMETRTELILLQRTMVVVEGVSRSLNPATMDIWVASRPVVEAYIAENIGPKALAKDLVRTARILSRLGPRLPDMARDLLIQRSATPTQPAKKSGSAPAFFAGIGCAVLAWLVLILV